MEVGRMCSRIMLLKRGMEMYKQMKECAEKIEGVL